MALLVIFLPFLLSQICPPIFTILWGYHRERLTLRMNPIGGFLWVVMAHNMPCAAIDSGASRPHCG